MQELEIQKHIELEKLRLEQEKLNPCPAEPGYTLPLQTV